MAELSMFCPWYLSHTTVSCDKNQSSFIFSSLLLEGHFFQDVLTTVTFYHYFRSFVTFKDSLLLDLYGTVTKEGRVLFEVLSFEGSFLSEFANNS